MTAEGSLWQSLTQALTQARPFESSLRAPDVNQHPAGLQTVQIAGLGPGILKLAVLSQLLLLLRHATLQLGGVSEILATCRGQRPAGDYRW